MLQVQCQHQLVMAVPLCKGLFQVKPCLDGQDVDNCDIALSATSTAPISSALCGVDHTFFLPSQCCVYRYCTSVGSNPMVRLSFIVGEMCICVWI